MSEVDPHASVDAQLSCCGPAWSGVPLVVAAFNFIVLDPLFESVLRVRACRVGAFGKALPLCPLVLRSSLDSSRTLLVCVLALDFFNSFVNAVPTFTFCPLAFVRRAKYVR